jgi:hypothetical protein
VNAEICRLRKADVAIERALLVRCFDSVSPILEASLLFRLPFLRTEAPRHRQTFVTQVVVKCCAAWNLFRGAELARRAARQCVSGVQGKKCEAYWQGGLVER